MADKSVWIITDVNDGDVYRDKSGAIRLFLDYEDAKKQAYTLGKSFTPEVLVTYKD